MAGNDKQFYKRFNAEQGTTPQDLQALSPPQSGLGISPGLSQYRYILLNSSGNTAIFQNTFLRKIKN